MPYRPRFKATSRPQTAQNQVPDGVLIPGPGDGHTCDRERSNFCWRNCKKKIPRFLSLNHAHRLGQIWIY